MTTLKFIGIKIFSQVLVLDQNISITIIFYDQLLIPVMIKAPCYHAISLEICVYIISLLISSSNQEMQESKQYRSCDH